MKNGMINLLDLTISIIQSKHMFVIFRLLSHTEITVNSILFHFNYYKIATNNSMIHLLRHIYSLIDNKLQN